MNRKTILVIAILNLTTLLLAALIMQSLSVQASPNTPASAPALIAYQGYLIDEAEKPIDTEDASLWFGIYSDGIPSSDDVILWQNQYDGVRIDDGYFMVTLPISASVFSEPERWIGMAVVEGSHYDYLSRQPLTSVPYALQAESAAQAASALQADSVPWSGLTGDPMARGCRVYQSQIQTLTTLPYTFAWSHELHDTGDCWSSDVGAAEKLTITAPGYYSAGAAISFGVTDVDNEKRVTIVLVHHDAAGEILEYPAAQTIFAQSNVINYMNVNAAMFYANPGEYLTLQIGGNTTGTVTINAANPGNPHKQSAWLVRLP